MLGYLSDQSFQHQKSLRKFDFIHIPQISHHQCTNTQSLRPGALNIHRAEFLRVLNIIFAFRVHKRVQNMSDGSALLLDSRIIAPPPELCFFSQHNTLARPSRNLSWQIPHRLCPSDPNLYWCIPIIVITTPKLSLRILTPSIHLMIMRQSNRMV